MRRYLRISGGVFGLIALLHVFRLLPRWPAQIAGWTLPIWISWIVILAAVALSIWAFRLVRQAGLSSGDAPVRAPPNKKLAAGLRRIRFVTNAHARSQALTAAADWSSPAPCDLFCLLRLQGALPECCRNKTSPRVADPLQAYLALGRGPRKALGS